MIIRNFEKSSRQFITQIKISPVHFPVSFVTLISVLYVGFLGIIIGILLCTILRYFSIFKPKHEFDKLSSLLKSQLIVVLICYLIFIPFDKYLLNSTILQTLADWQIYKQPEIKAYISTYTKGASYQNYYEWLQSRGMLFKLLYSWQGALYLSFVCASVWFALVLPIAFEFRSQLKERSTKKLAFAIAVSSLLIISGISFLQFDAFYLSSRRVDIYSPLALPVLAYSIILFGTVMLGMCFGKQEPNSQ